MNHTLALALYPPDGEIRLNALRELCPYGQKGDRLWVRETWAMLSYWATMDCVHSYQNEAPIYRAEGLDWTDVTWKPSIHMPRWASRILLEITNVRVERVCEISEEDAQAEGCHNRSDLAYATGHWGMHHDPAKWAVENGHRYAFQDLWDSINAKAGKGWDVNPWVWVVEFKVLTPSPSEAEKMEGAL
ncbi:MAG: hypothetical protein AAFX93_15845 [Verrucomicrobiota bacterium]